jgi:hypothetical protein
MFSEEGRGLSYFKNLKGPETKRVMIQCCEICRHLAVKCFDLGIEGSRMRITGVMTSATAPCLLPGLLTLSTFK